MRARSWRFCKINLEGLSFTAPIADHIDRFIGFHSAAHVPDRNRVTLPCQL